MSEALVDLVTRPVSSSDLDEIGRLLDDTLGRGYWSLDPTQAGSHRIAMHAGAIVGIASASIIGDLPDAPGLEAPVALVRIVAVDAAARGRGIASRLVREVCDQCGGEGVVDMAAYAWVYASSGIAPLAGVLEHAGFTCERRISDFYSSDMTEVCRGCGMAPCVCPADLYVCRRSVPRS